MRLGAPVFSTVWCAANRVDGRRPAGAGDQARCVGFEISASVQPGIGDGLAHRDVGIGRTRPHEAQGALVDMLGDVDVERAADLAAKAVFGHLLVAATMPDLPAFSAAVTSSAELPMDETIPSPVTTTRRMALLLLPGCQPAAAARPTFMSVTSHTVSPSATTRPSATPNLSLRSMTRVKST